MIERKDKKIVNDNFWNFTTGFFFRNYYITENSKINSYIMIPTTMCSRKWVCVFRTELFWRCNCCFVGGKNTVTHHVKTNICSYLLH